MGDTIQNSNTHQISGGFSLIAADPKIFVNYYTVYKNSNPFHRFTWEHYLYAINDESPCHWVYKDGALVGGSLVAPNRLSGVFTIPPYNDNNALLRSLTQYVISISDTAKPIRAIGVAPWQLEFYTRHGFRIIEGKRNMIRPTEVMSYAFAPEFEVLPACADYAKMAIDLLVAAFAGNAGRPITFEEIVDTVQVYYNTLIKRDSMLPEASSLVFDRATGQLVALCHVIMWEGWPLIDDVVVHPDYQGRGLATNMIKKSLSISAMHYPAMRLFVTVGNPAQSVYYNLGFLPAPEFYELEIPSGILNH